MGRIKLDIPESLPFSTTLRIRVTDLNYGNHLANDAILRFMHEARRRFFEAHGFPEMVPDGPGFLVGDCAIEFKAEGFYGQGIEIKVGMGDYARVSFDAWFRFVREEDQKVMVLGKTGMVYFDYGTRKVKSIPPEMRAAFGDAGQGILPRPIQPGA